MDQNINFKHSFVTFFKHFKLSHFSTIHMYCHIILDEKLTSYTHYHTKTDFRENHKFSFKIRKNILPYLVHESTRP